MLYLTRTLPAANFTCSRLKAFVTSPDVAEALFVATPSLAESIPVWLRQPLSERGQKVERALVKYLARMSARATPFGLFSGCSTGVFGGETRLSLGPRSEYQRHSRLDMDYVCAVTEALNRDPGLRLVLEYRPNDTLVALGRRYRYVEPRIGQGNTRYYHLVAVEATEHLDLVLRETIAGARHDAIVAALVKYDAEVTREEAAEYVDELIANHVLVSNLRPAVTGPEPARDIAARMRALGKPEQASALEDAVAQLDRIDEQGLGHASAAYVAVHERLKAVDVPVDIARLTQVDMRKPGEIVLGPAARAEIERCADLAARFGITSEWLANFRTAFDKRYGSAYVPLLQVLDEERAGSGSGRSNLRTNRRWSQTSRFGTAPRRRPRGSRGTPGCSNGCACSGRKAAPSWNWSTPIWSATARTADVPPPTRSVCRWRSPQRPRRQSTAETSRSCS